VAIGLKSVGWLALPSAVIGLAGFYLAGLYIEDYSSHWYFPPPPAALAVLLATWAVHGIVSRLILERHYRLGKTQGIGIRWLASAALSGGLAAGFALRRSTRRVGVISIVTVALSGVLGYFFGAYGFLDLYHQRIMLEEESWFAAAGASVGIFIGVAMLLILFRALRSQDRDRA
jgi:hypothetical protein